MSFTKTAEKARAPATEEEALAVRRERISLHNQVWFQRLLVWGSLLVVWEILGMVLGPFFLPRFTQVLNAMWATFGNGDMATLLGSLRQMFIGFGLAAVIGIPLGLLMGVSRAADYVLGIYVNALFVTSMEALLPFIIILFGTEFKFRVVVVVLFALFYIIINTAAGVRSVPRDLLETAAAFCTPRLRVFTTIMIPAALPYIVAGLRLGLGHAIKGMVIAELWITIDTGRRLVDLGLARKLPEFFALALWIVLVGAVLTQLLLMIQQRLTPAGVDITTLGSGRRK